MSRWESGCEKRCFALSATPTPVPPPSSFLSAIDLQLIFSVLIVAAVALVVERLFSTYMSRFASRVKLEPNTTNNLILVVRIIILLLAIAVLSRIGGLQPEWIVSASAIGGAALGFASQKTIGNFIAGIFLISAHPFKVGDYVRIGSVEGVVQEITINYTKVSTIANNTILVSNLQILDRDITNFSYEMEKVGKAPAVYCYTFEMGFDHVVSSPKICECFETVFKNHLLEMPRKPAYTLVRSGAFDRFYLVYVYVRRSEDIFKWRSQIANEVYALWDQERTKAKGQV
jgi:hypothetical protein